MWIFWSRCVFWLATFITIWINSLASLPLNNVTTAELSSRFITMITPAGFTFGIWWLIYLSLIIISTMVLTGKITFRSTTIWAYIASCVFNSAWIFTWHYQMIALSLVLIVLLVLSLIITITSHSQWTHSSYYHFVHTSLMMYLGWVSIASLLMLTIFLMYNTSLLDYYVIEWSMWVLIVAWILNLLIIQHKKNLTTSLVLLRALYGIMGQSDSLYPDDISISITALVVWSIVATIMVIEYGAYIREQYMSRTRHHS